MELKRFFKEGTEFDVLEFSLMIESYTRLLNNNNNSGITVSKIMAVDDESDEYGPFVVRWSDNDGNNGCFTFLMDDEFFVHRNNKLLTELVENVKRSPFNDDGFELTEKTDLSLFIL